MALLKKATKNISYAKVGIYGEAGSGKTVTASKLAIGLHKTYGLKKPIAFFDTEPAANFVLPLFENAGIELVTFESRALVDLIQVMDEAESECSAIIVDSTTHVWKEAQESYIKRVNSDRKKYGKKPINSIEFQDWRHIKNEWAQFTNRFLSSKLHCFVCGRAGTMYEYQRNDRTGKMELISTGTKMATEKEMAYEPSLLIEMKKIVGDGQGIVNRALVEKDRNIMNPLTGQWVDFPDFHHFKPHWDSINIGGEHFDMDMDTKSENMYAETGEDTFSYERRQREILCEEIKSLFITHDLDGSTKAVKEKRNKVLLDVFETGSWTKIESTYSDKLRLQLEKLRYYLEGSKETQVVNKKNKEKNNPDDSVKMEGHDALFYATQLASGLIKSDDSHSSSQSVSQLSQSNDSASE